MDIFREINFQFFLNKLWKSNHPLSRIPDSNKSSLDFERKLKIHLLRLLYHISSRNTKIEHSIIHKIPLQIYLFMENKILCLRKTEKFGLFEKIDTIDVILVFISKYLMKHLFYSGVTVISFFLSEHVFAADETGIL